MERDEDIINDLAHNFVNPNANEELLTAINLGIAEGFCRNGDIEDGMALYEKIAVSNAKLKSLISPEFIQKIKNLADELFKNKKYTNALIQYKRILSIADLSAQEHLNLAICLIELGQEAAAVEFLHKYEEAEPNKESAYGTVGEILGLKLGMYPEAIGYLEKYIQLNEKNALAYNTLGHFYCEQYNDKFLDKQLECFLKAIELHPYNKIYIKNVIFVYEKLGDLENTEKFYKKLLKLNPTPLDYYNYGCSLIKQGNLSEGYKHFGQRFFSPELTGDYPHWLDINKRLTSLDDLSDKTVLLFHEAGFGDSIMYVRFVEEFKKRVGKIILFVPEKLITLFKNIHSDIEIHPMTDDLSELEYDCNATLIDLPYLLSATTETIPNPEGYIKISEEKISAYKKLHLKDNGKFKIGISYCANPEFKNAGHRNIPLTAFYPLTKLENVEVYSLQVSDSENQMKKLPPDVKIIDLAKTFNDFEDAASAMKNMDLIMTTDNVILNLSGALGVKTVALFNRFHEYRWFRTKGEDVGWYKSVKPYCAESFNCWDELIERVISDLKNNL